MINTPNWHPFAVASRDFRPDYPRSMNTIEGVGDRLRAAAFAELQAREAFQWAAAHFEEAPLSLRRAWEGLALAEDRHLSWLLKRMEELKINIQERNVSDLLWVSLVSCKSASEFAHFMASAEERGRKAGERFYSAMRERDSVTAEIFHQIALEEIEHIKLASKYFGPEVCT